MLDGITVGWRVRFWVVAFKMSVSMFGVVGGYKIHKLHCTNVIYIIYYVYYII